MLRTAPLRTSLLLLPAAVLSACSAATRAEHPGPPVAIRAVTDTVLTVVAGAALLDSLVVRVVDDQGRGVPGHPVSWVAETRGLSLSPTSALSDRRVRARSALRLGTAAGEHTATASALTVDGPAAVRFRIIAAPGPAASIRLAPQNAFVAAGDSLRLSVILTDPHGNAIDGRPVTWSSADPAVASVHPRTGMVRGVSTGTAGITATAEGRSAATPVTVVRAFSGEDAFDAGTPGPYTQHADVAGGWRVSGGVLTASGMAQQSVFIRDDVVLRDGWVEAEMDRADEGGLVLRFQDEGNYYLLTIHDDGSLLGHRNLEIFRRNGRVWQIFSTADVDWTRGTVRTIRFEARGSALLAYADGVLISTVADATIPGAGRIGLRYHDVPEALKTDVARYLTFRWSARR